MPNFRVTCRITDEYFLDEWVALKPPLITMWEGNARNEIEARTLAAAKILREDARKGVIIGTIQQ